MRGGGGRRMAADLTGGCGLHPRWVLRSAGRAYWTEAPARPAVSNAVALADILRSVVVADQAAGQKDVEADLWVRVSAV